jgi:L-cystine uptake protein TcyP (sodium:dicarboxylate symporter family)
MFGRLKKIKKGITNAAEFNNDDPVNVAEKTSTNVTKSVKDFLGGNFLNSEFLKKQYGVIIVLVVVSFIGIALRYHCEKQLAEIDKLQRNLENARYTYLTISCDLIEESRESKVAETVKEKGIALQKSKTPPYKLD